MQPYPQRPLTFRPLLAAAARLVADCVLLVKGRPPSIGKEVIAVAGASLNMGTGLTMCWSSLPVYKTPCKGRSYAASKRQKGCDVPVKR